MPKNIDAVLIDDFITRLSVPVVDDDTIPADDVEYLVHELLNNSYYLFKNPTKDGGFEVSDQQLYEWVASQAPQKVVRKYRDDDPYTLSESLVVWPDGSLGQLIMQDYAAEFKEHNRFHILHAWSGKRVIQNKATRNALGMLLDVPELVMGTPQLPDICRAPAHQEAFLKHYGSPCFE